MAGAALQAIMNLVSAGETVGQNARLGTGTQGWEQGVFGHPQADICMFALDAETACHSAATGVDQLEFQVRNRFQYLAHRFHRAGGLLVTVAVYQQRLIERSDRREGQVKPSAGDFAGQKFLEQQGMLSELYRFITESEKSVVITDCQQAGRFKSDNAAAGPHMRQQCLDQAPSFPFGFRYQAIGQLGAPATEWPLIGIRPGKVHLVTGAFQYFAGRRCCLGGK